METHLVKTLQQAHNATLDLILVQRATGAVESHSLDRHSAGDDSAGGEDDRRPSGDGGTDGTGGRSEHDGAEHLCGGVYVRKQEKPAGGRTGFAGWGGRRAEEKKKLVGGRR